MISYKPLKKLLIDKNMNKTQLRDLAGFSNGTLSRISKDQYIEMKHLDKICDVLNCRIEDVIEFVKDDGSENCND